MLGCSRFREGAPEPIHVSVARPRGGVGKLQESSQEIDSLLGEDYPSLELTAKSPPPKKNDRNIAPRGNESSELTIHFQGRKAVSFGECI